jgi:low temperature requirement protein LtrA
MRRRPFDATNFIRITFWQSLGGIFWIGGAFLEADQRLAAWAIAVFIEYISPSLWFWTPGLGRSPLAELDVEGGHMAERAGLFIIIALGESILVTGATFAQSDFSLAGIGAFTVAFTGSVAMWWIYFNNTAEHPHARVNANPAEVARTSAIARNGYTYFHTIIVAGIIVSAVGDELVLAHPVGHHADLAAILTITGGPLLYLVGIGLFKGFLQRRTPVSITVAAAALLAVALAGQAFDPLPVALMTAVVLVALAAWDSTRASPAAMRAADSV